MVAEDFIASKRPAWEQLETLLGKIRRGRLHALEAGELYDLGRLYRQATSDLAVARRDWPNHRMVDYLNGLVARAHGEIYRNEAATWRRLRDFVLVLFPQVWRRILPWTATAFLCFTLPALVAFVVSYNDPSKASLLFPGADSVVADIKAHNEWWQKINEQGRGSNATLIMSNNILVSIKAFAGGVLLGLYAIYAMLFNGLMLGTIAGLSQFYGFAPRLWGFIAPHAPIELSVIFFSGGAGLHMGWALVHPGLLGRGAALREAAERAVVIMIGCVPLLAVAGLIEAFISPSALPLWFKLCVSIATGVALYAYLLGAGRPERDQAK
ncbi:MAG TPA: stage II sporulation protein M [Herpetosiphonaceae bacterium]|nr:stage II sporulation protein M [Herpetosiphonaceae bacterium]